MNMRLGIDIGGTFIKYGIVNENFEILSKWKVKTERFKEKDDFYDYVCSNIRQMDKIEKISVSAPGLIDKESNINSYAGKNLWVIKGSNINKEISLRTGKIVNSINDAKAAGLCEFKIGNAKNTKLSAFMILGTGTGGCICNENGVIYGKDSFAGEIHHLAFKNTTTGEIERMGNYSCMDALVEYYNSKVEEKNKVLLGKDVCKLYLNGNKKAESAVSSLVENIIIQLINITVLYNPEVICIGGGISEEEWFMDLIKDKYKVTITEYIGENILTTEIKNCRYNNDSNILGAVISGLEN